MKKIFYFLNLLFLLLLLVSCSKIILATPTNLSISGSLLSWETVEYAAGYTVKIGEKEINCNYSPFELSQFSLEAGKYYVMVKARGRKNYLDSDYSIAIEYIKEDNNNDAEDLPSNNIDASFLKSNNRYSIVCSPIINNAPPLIASSTDYTYNYYLVDGGYIQNTPISSGITLRYNGQTPIKASFEKSYVTTNRIEETISRTISESVSERFTGEATFNVSYETGELAKLLAGKISVGADYSRQWGTITEKSNSTSSIYMIASEIAESLTQSIEYTIGEHNEKIGDYRLSMVTTCDVYYLVTVSHDNTKLKEIKMILCARPDVTFVLEYSENGVFRKTSTSPKLDWPENFYQNYEVPTQELSSTITLNVDGGYTLEQSTFNMIIGKSYELPVPIRYNYGFVGWYSEPNGKGKKYTDYTGKLNEVWAEYEEKILYANWVLISNKITSINQIQLSSQQIWSEKSNQFSLGLDIESLKEAGYSKLKIGISGACSGYDYRMNERGRYFVLSDAAKNIDIMSWSFMVKNFSCVEEQLISIENFNGNGQYKLQLVSDQSNAYDEKLIVSNIVITIIATK